MKIFQTFTLILSTATLFLLVACSKQQDTEPTPQPQPAEAPAAATPGEPEAAALPDAAAVKETADKTVEAATEAVKETATEVQNGAQKIIDEAKTLVDQSKMDQALEMLGKLGDMKLTPEQQSMVDKLTASIQKALANGGAEDAKKAVGNLLDGK
jgi:hypothetical protein